MTTSFNFDKPIYRQIIDLMGENILRGEWPEEERIPAVREFAVQLQVNPNTVMRAYEYLQSKEIIESRRGIGYFVAPGAVERIRRDERDLFMMIRVPEIMGRMDMLGITPEELMERFKFYSKDEDKH
jgi:DNA-binding transcriptional regulator YhcF (GntR family)